MNGTNNEDNQLNDQSLKEYKPSKSKILQENRVEIEFCTIGCMIRVGCKKISFYSTEEAMIELNKYVQNPYEAHQKWNKIFNENN